MSINRILEYVNENYIGIFLLIFSFFIIYFVDHINNFNALLYQVQSPIPGLPSPVNPLSKKKIKKR